MEQDSQSKEDYEDKEFGRHSTEEYREDIEEGKTVEEIAEDKNVTLSTVVKNINNNRDLQDLYRDLHNLDSDHASIKQDPGEEYYREAIEDSKNVMDMAKETLRQERTVIEELNQYGLVSKYMDQQDIEPKGTMVDRKRTDSFYKEAAEAGDTLTEIARSRNVKLRTALNRISQNLILDLYREKHDIKSRYEHYRDNIERGKSITEIARDLGTSLKGTHSYIKANGLLELYRQRRGLPSSVILNRGGGSYKGLEELIEDDTLKLRDLGEEFDVTHERIRQVMKERGLYDRYKEVRKPERRKRAYSDLANALSGILAKEADEDEALKHTLLYFDSIQRSSKDKETVYNFFRNYHDAKNRGEEKPLSELIEGTDISNSSEASRALRKIGLNTLVNPEYRRKIKTLTEKEKSLVDKAVHSKAEIGNKDMSFIFKRLTGRYIPRNSFYRYAQGKETPSRRNKHVVLTSEDGVIFTYKALELLEALDADFSKEEAKEYADITSERAFREIRENREEIESEVERFTEDIGMENQTVEDVLA